ncbi:MAG: tetratricopeptide repeat protein, partial [Nitrospirota bacterium]
MSALCKCLHVRQFILIVAGLLSFFVGFWPMPGFGHQAGEFYHKAVEAIQDKNLQQADSLLQQAISDFPAYAEAHHLLGIVQYQMTQDPDKAIPSLRQAVQLNGNFAQAHYDLALLLLKKERIEEAKQQLQHALTVYPEFWEARLTLAKIFDQTGATDKAIQEYETVLKSQPLASEALYHLAYHFMQNGDSSQAQELLTRLTKHDSQHSEGWYLLGRLAEQRQQFVQAIEAYKHVLQNKP